MFAFNHIRLETFIPNISFGYTNMREKLILEKQFLFLRQLHKSVKMFLQKKRLTRFYIYSRKIGILGFL